MQTNPNINAERIKGHLELDAGTSTSSPLHFNDGAGRVSPLVGDMDFESDRLKLEITGGPETIAFLSDITGGSGVTSVAGTSNRITSTGGATPQIDIASTYVGQNSITTLGTIATGVWQGTAIADGYVASSASWNAKLSSVTGTTNRISVTSGSIIDIDSNYQGQTSIVTVGSISTGVWRASQIIDTYIASAATWNAKQSALSGTGFVKISGTTISYDNSTYITPSSTNTLTNKSGNVSQWTNDSNYAILNVSTSNKDIIFYDSASGKITGNSGTFQYDNAISEFKSIGGTRFNIIDGGTNYTITAADYGVCSNTATNGSGQYDLPQATSAKFGKLLMIKNTGTGANTLTVKPFAGDTIDGSGAGITLQPIGGVPTSLNAITLQCDGNQWLIFGALYN